MVLEHFPPAEHTQARCPLVMGVLNVTPDSFSDGGQFDSVDAQLNGAWKCSKPAPRSLMWVVSRHGRRESTTEQGNRCGCGREKRSYRSFGGWRSKVPSGLHRYVEGGGCGSRLRCGAHWVNDVSGLRMDLNEFLVARKGCPIVMHMRGTPITMNHADTFEHVAQEVAAELMESVQIALDHGAQPTKSFSIRLGFGKKGEQNYRILAGMESLRALGYPICRSLAEVLRGYDGPEEPARAGLCDGSNRRSWLLFRSRYPSCSQCRSHDGCFARTRCNRTRECPHLQPRAGGTDARGIEFQEITRAVLDIGIVSYIIYRTLHLIKGTAQPDARGNSGLILLFFMSKDEYPFPTLNCLRTSLRFVHPDRHCHLPGGHSKGATQVGKGLVAASPSSYLDELIQALLHLSQSNRGDYRERLGKLDLPG